MISDDELKQMREAEASLLEGEWDTRVFGSGYLTPQDKDIVVFMRNNWSRLIAEIESLRSSNQQLTSSKEELRCEVERLREAKEIQRASCCADNEIEAKEWKQRAEKLFFFVEQTFEHIKYCDHCCFSPFMDISDLIADYRASLSAKAEDTKEYD